MKIIRQITQKNIYAKRKLFFIEIISKNVVLKMSVCLCMMCMLCINTITQSKLA